MSPPRHRDTRDASRHRCDETTAPVSGAGEARRRHLPVERRAGFENQPKRVERLTDDAGGKQVSMQKRPILSSRGERACKTALAETIFRQMRRGGVTAVPLHHRYHEKVTADGRQYRAGTAGSSASPRIPTRDAAEIHRASRENRTAIFLGLQNPLTNRGRYRLVEICNMPRESASCRSPTTIRACSRTVRRNCGPAFTRMEAGHQGDEPRRAGPSHVAFGERPPSSDPRFRTDARHTLMQPKSWHAAMRKTNRRRLRTLPLPAACSASALTAYLKDG